MDTRTSTVPIQVLVALILLAASFPRPTSAQNVTWTIPTSIATCPAGDSVTSGIPSRLRIMVRYLDGAGAPKAHVPPESIWVTLQGLPYEWSSRAYDEHKEAGGISQVFALDSTDVQGYTRLEVPSVTGVGSQYVTLYVSEEVKATTLVTVRSTDVDASGETGASDVSNPCDINYDGRINNKDVAIIAAHQ